ncbi:MAG: MFS transporter [Bdellovibrionota bacterium]
MLSKYFPSFFKFKKDQWAWSMYDWANSAFATTVMAGFFPVFFKKFYAANYSSSESTAFLAYANAVALLLVLVTAPVLGQYTDRSHNKKKALLSLTVLGALSCIALAFLSQGAVLYSVLLFITGNFAFSTACAPYDSLLVSVSTDKEADRVSSLGYSMGYLGGGILFAINLLMYQKPELFGLADGAAAIKASFASVGVWWLIFTLPLMLSVHEKDFDTNNEEQEGLFLKNIKRVFTHSPQLKIFLIAFFLYSDGVGTVIRMAVDYGVSIGLEAGELMLALLMVQIVAFPATLLLAKLVEKVSPRKAILGLLMNYVLIVLWGSVLHSKWEFFVVILLLAFSQGGVQALSRSLFMRLIPASKAGEFFGVYNLLGKFAGIVGSTLMGTVAWLSGSHRLGLASVAVLFIAGAWFLKKVDLKGDRANGVSLA